MAARNHRESVRLALDTLRQHKLRSFLTVLGVVMGVGVLMLVAALITGFDASVVETITRFGADTASISRFRQGPRIGGPRPSEERARKPLTLEDGLALTECCPAVQQVTVWITQWEQTHRARYQGNEVSLVDLRGALPNFPFVLANTNMVEGRFFTDTENAHREPVVVLGQDTASALFGQLPATGKEVLVDGQAYRVIGVLTRPEGNFGPNDEDRRVLLPYQTFKKAYPSSYENAYRFQAGPGQLDAAVDQVREFLRRRRGVLYSEPDTFRDPHGDAADRGISQHRGHGGGGDGGAQLDRLADRRRGRDEHHAGERHRAHARNRSAQGRGRAQQRHRLAVLIRSDGAHRRGRPHRRTADRRIGAADSHGDKHARLRATVGRGCGAELCRWE